MPFPRSTPSPETALEVGQLLLKTVLSNPYVDVALVGMREPRFVDLNNEISDGVALPIDLAELHDRYLQRTRDDSTDNCAPNR